MNMKRFIEDVSKTLDERSEEYGKLDVNFNRICELWNQWCWATGVTSVKNAFSPLDAATMLMMVKIARLMGNPQSEDSYFDIAGYAAVMHALRPTKVIGKEEPEEEPEDEG